MSHNSSTSIELTNDKFSTNENCQNNVHNHQDKNLYQLLVDWYETTHFKKSLSSTQLTNLWSTLWFAKREQQKLVDTKFMKYRYFIEHFIDYQPTNLYETMAMIILYDQITRNIFRATENAYKYDDIARTFALSLLENVSPSTLPIHFVLTIIICLIHSEQIQHLDLAQNLIEQYLVEHRFIDPNLLFSLKGISKNHRDRLHLFGRIPERNRFINRQSTAAEISFIKAVNIVDLFE